MDLSEDSARLGRKKNLEEAKRLMELQIIDRWNIPEEIKVQPSAQEIHDSVALQIPSNQQMTVL